MDAQLSEKVINCLLDQVDELKQGSVPVAKEGKLLTGCIPALITPFKDDGEVNVDVIPKLTEYHIAAGCTGFYLCGNTGEGFSMTVAQRKTMVEKTVAAVAGRDFKLVVHVGACPLADAQELARHAKAQGCDAISSVVPIDKPKDLQAAVDYFKGVGEVCKIPFYVYWVGNNMDSAVSAVQFLEAMKVVPNFAGFKFTDTNFYTFQQLVYAAPSVVGHQVNAVTGPDEMAVAGLIMGSDGAIGSTYNIQPKINVQMHADFKAGRIASAMQLQVQANAFIAKLLEMASKYNVPTLTAVIGGIKAVYRARGFEVGRAKGEAETPFPDAAVKELTDFCASAAWTVE